MESEWPRGRRRDRNKSQVVCSLRFRFTENELEELAKITDVPLDSPEIEITKDYEGRFEVIFPNELFPNRLHPNAIDRICESLPSLPHSVGEAFGEKAASSAHEARRLARHEGRFGDFVKIKS